MKLRPDCRADELWENGHRSGQASPFIIVSALVDVPLRWTRTCSNALPLTFGAGVATWTLAGANQGDTHEGRLIGRISQRWATESNQLVQLKSAPQYAVNPCGKIILTIFALRSWAQRKALVCDNSTAEAPDNSFAILGLQAPCSPRTRLSRPSRLRFAVMIIGW